MLSVSSALAGPNAGGTLVVHSCGQPCYSAGEDTEGYCGHGLLPTSCENVVTKVATGEIGTWHVFAAFPDGGLPRLSGLTFGVDYDSSTVYVIGFGHCGDFEVTTASWPAPDEGTAVTFAEPQTQDFVEIYWFAGYEYLGIDTSFDLIPHPTQGGSFGDDDVPSNADPIAGYGRLGFNGDPGLLPCPAPLPLAACCFVDGTCGLLTAPDCVVAGGDPHPEEVECEPNPCPQPPPGACCFSDGSCSFLTVFECAEQGGDFVGEGVLCEGHVCPPLGACCLIDGTCEILEDDACTDANGLFQGEGVPCEGHSCPPTGACCFPDGACFFVFEEVCLGSGAEFVGGACEPNPCEQPWACCFESGECVLLLADVCASQGGIYLDETPCDPYPCPDPIMGACCSEDDLCLILSRFDCENLERNYIGDEVPCDPNPCPGACCLPEADECVLMSHAECELIGGTFYSSLDCDPNPCVGVGACCYGYDCVQLPAAECLLTGGIFGGVGVPCDDDFCTGVACSGERVSLAEIGLAGDLTNRGDSATASLEGPGGVLVDEESRGCGVLLFNADETYENGYAWRYDGVVPPCFGSFAEQYVEDGFVCALVLDLSTTGTQAGQVLDAYIWEDVEGFPGAVLAIAVGEDPGPIATWPSVSRHSIPISSVPVTGEWWCGYWGDWPGEVQGWFIAADLDGFGGRPATAVAPGVGYPSGWQNVSVVWGPTQAIGIGVEIVSEDRGACCIEDTCFILTRAECEERDGDYHGAGSECEPEICDPIPVVEKSWGEIKARFR